MPNRFSEQIEQILAPVVGDFMAKMAVKAQCKSLGITPDNITIAHLPDLAQKIGDAMAFMGKREQSESIVGRIQGLR